MPIKYTREFFIEQSTKIHGGIYRYHLIPECDWTGIHRRFPVYCTKHHIIYDAFGETHIQGKSLCPECLRDIRSEHCRRVIEKLVNNNSNHYKDIVRKLKEDIDENGLNSYERNNRRIAEEGKLDIDENGLNRQQRNSERAKKTLRNNVDENGKNGIERITEKRIKTQFNDIDSEGLNTFQRAARKRTESGLIDIDPVTGLNRLERAAQKSVQERMQNKEHWQKEVQARIDGLAKIDENGLDAWDRGLIKAQKYYKYKDTDLYYQGSNELKFLETLERNTNLKWVVTNVTRGNPLKYIDPSNRRERIYKPDFIISNTILYEIKSKWTWNRKGKEPILEEINKTKLNAAKAIYEKVFLILDGEEIEWPNE